MFFGEYSTLQKVQKESEERSKTGVNENDIKELVSLSKNLGGSVWDTTKSAVVAYGISEKEAEALVQKYWQ